MSRTYRTQMKWRKLAHGRYWTNDEEMSYLGSLGLKWWSNKLGWNRRRFIDRKSRDNKPWNKPPRWFKAMNRRWERNRVNQAVRIGREPPTFRKSDRWEWT
jgi:hypothetical protein